MWHSYIFHNLFLLFYIEFSRRTGKLLNADYITVVAGTPNRLEEVSTTQISKANKLIPHPDYNQDLGNQCDVGLVFLSTDFSLGPHVAVISLARRHPVINLDCTVVGWGNIIQVRYHVLSLLSKKF